MTPRALVLHTVGVRGDTSMAAIRKYHMTPEAEGGPVGGPWRDAGYHYGVGRDGRLELGRPTTQAGAHTQGANDTIGVVVYGDGDVEPWTYRQWETVLALTDRYPLLPVLGHREAPARLAGAAPTTKTCPGRLVDLAEVRAEVARRRARP